MKNPIWEFQKYIKIFYRHLGPKIFVVYLLIGIETISGGFGIVMIMPLLDLISGAVPKNNNSDLIGRLVDYLVLNFSVAEVLIILAIIFFVKGIIAFWVIAFGNKLRSELLVATKRNLYNKFSAVSFEYFLKKNTGHFINVINEQVNQMLNAFKSSVLVISDLFSACIYLIIAIIVSWKFGILALICGIVFTLLFKWVNIFARKMSRIISYENSILSKHLIEGVQAFKYLKSTSQEDKIARKINTTLNSIGSIETKKGLADAAVIAIKEPIAVFSLLGLIAYNYYSSGDGISQILVSLFCFHRALQGFIAVNSNWMRVMALAGSIETVDLEIESLAKYSENTGHSNFKELAEPIIEFDRVSFSYDNSSLSRVINSISFKLYSKTCVAIVGASGSGKSTIIDLITGILNPCTGSVNICGVPQKDLNIKTWRECLGIVSQDMVIFDDTIGNNISMWADHVGGTLLNSKIIAAAKIAKIHEFIEGLPDGYSTLVGDRGVRLSGGQKQRLFIAREIFKNPKVLIMDEATSSLDNETESSISDSLVELNGKMTILIIAHRLSTIKNVDNIIVLEGGEIIESGTYIDLTSDSNTRLYRMLESQY